MWEKKTGAADSAARFENLERYPSGQREQTVNLSADAFEGSNPSLSIVKLVRSSWFVVRERTFHHVMLSEALHLLVHSEAKHLTFFRFFATQTGSSERSE
jgi:hypothetical protein